MEIKNKAVVNFETRNQKPLDYTPISRPAQKKKLSRWLLFGLMVLILFLLGITGILYDENRKLKKQLTEKNLKSRLEATQAPQSDLTEITPTTSSGQTSESTIDWEEYVSNEYGFQFKYPPNYNLEKLPPIEDRLLRLILVRTGLDFAQTPSISFVVLNSGKSIKQIIRELKDQVEEYRTAVENSPNNSESIYYDLEAPEPPSINSVEEIIVSGKKGVKVERYLGSGGPNPRILEYYLELSGGQILVISANYGTKPSEDSTGYEEKEDLLKIITTLRIDR